jgi:hypothetical protein
MMNGEGAVGWCACARNALYRALRCRARYSADDLAQFMKQITEFLEQRP